MPSVPGDRCHPSLETILQDFRRRLTNAPAFVESAPKRQAHALPRPEPGWRYLRLIEPSQITTERWTALSRSQIRAARLIRAGSSEQALQALREGTWRNPEEELRKLAIRFPRRRQPGLPTNLPDQRVATTPK